MSCKFIKLNLITVWSLMTDNYLLKEQPQETPLTLYLNKPVGNE
jgi:hypothetical protein